MTASPTQVAWRERTILVSGLRIACFETGSTAPGARTIVLIHGLGHWTQAAWTRMAERLDPALRIVAFDLPGFGASDKPDVRYDGPFFDAAIDAVIAEVVPEPFVLVGHSLGGYLAARLAARSPDRVARLVLIAPAGYLRTARFVYALLGSRLASWLFQIRPSPKFVRRTLAQSVVDPTCIDESTYVRAIELGADDGVRRAFAGVYTGAMQEFANARALHARLATYRGPVLIVWGRQDRYIPIAALAPTKAVYPQADVVICEHSGHLPMVEEPDRVATALTAFIG
jgi:pimeloyl-ACP methyl ester carboxylesterase